MLTLVKIYKNFLWIKFYRKIDFSSLVTVIALSNFAGGFLPNFLFKIVWNATILIVPLFSCAIHFSCCCCWKSSAYVVSVTWYSILWFCCASLRKVNSSLRFTGFIHSAAFLTIDLGKASYTFDRYFWTSLATCWTSMWTSWSDEAI